MRSSLAFRLFVCVSIAGGLAGLTARGSAAQPVTPIRLIEIEGPIDRPLLEYVEERLAAAERAGAVVVLQLDTPGALDQDGLALAERVATMEVPTLAWVGPAPARASGAGLLLMLASSAASIAPGAQTGPLLPIDVLHPDEQPEHLASSIQRWLRSHGRDEVDVSAAGRPIAAQDAIDAGIAEVAAYTVPELLREVDGMTVRSATGEVVLRTRVATTQAEAGERTVDIRFEEPGTITRVLHAVSTPSMVYLLLVVGLAALAFEVTQPGFGFAGFSGLGLLALAVYGITVATPSWGWLAVLLGGIALLILDVRWRSLSWPTWAGLVAFGTGSILAWAGVASAIRISPWLIGGAIAASLLYYGFALTVALQSRDRLVGTQRGLVGLVGEARGRLAPDGPVFVKGALWRGRTTGAAIEPGTVVRVRGVEGLILRVEEEPAETAGSSVP